MKKRPTLKFLLLTVLFALLFVGQVAAQTVQLSLRYNAGLTRYEVFALPSQTNAPFLWGLAQISLVVPASVANDPLTITNATAIIWQNGDEIYAPAVSPGSDFHSFITTGASINFTAGVEVLLFHFSLPGGCVPGLRVFNNGSDPASNAPGMMMADFRNSIAYVIPGQGGGQAYTGNFDNAGTTCGPVFCGCSDVYVILDPATCAFQLTPDMVGRGNTCPPGTTVRVVDNNPGNGDIIDCAGTWTYGLFDADGKLICWGKVNAEDKSGPLVNGYWGQCEFGSSAPNTVAPPTATWTMPTATFLCTDVNAVLNDSRSWTSAANAAGTYRYFAGRPSFQDACDASAFCDCRTDVKVTDQVTFYTCDNNIRQDQRWASILRTFTATDCRGNETKVTQTINFLRPTIAINQQPNEITLKDDACSSDTDVMIADLKRRFYIHDDPYSCDANEKYAYFQEAVGTQSGNVRKRLECNYSFDVVVFNGNYEVCNGGRKVGVYVKYFDWCTGVSTTIDTILLKWFDGKGPEFTMPNKPIVISTGAMDCTAAFGIDLNSLKDFFGVNVTDNCGAVTANVEIWSCTDSLVYGIPVAGKAWRKTTYQSMWVGTGTNRRLIVSGVPVGRHYLHITAFDNCYNQSEKWVPFTVADKIAPVMKCDDQLNVTLSNSQGGPYAQGFPTLGTGIFGYAKVLATEIDEGSADNCGLDWIRVRRSYNAACKADFIAKGYDSNGDGEITTADGIDWNRDGDIDDDMEKFQMVNGVLMTPALDFVEFFCCDLGDDGVMIELWGKDKETSLNGLCGGLQGDSFGFPGGEGGAPSVSGGNKNYCWMVVKLEDKVAPTFIRPWDATITCLQRELLDAIKTDRTISLNSAEYKFIEDEIFAKQGMGRFTIMSGNDCQDLDVDVTIDATLHCDAGTVTVKYTGKKTVKGVVRTFDGGTATIFVEPVHEYNIKFPADRTGDCVSVTDTANVIDGGELSCDVLAVLVQDKRYNGATLNGAPIAECYKIFRTFTVVNWCQYDERCGEPMNWAVVVPRDPRGNGFNGVNVLVRDTDRNKVEEIWYEDASGTVAYPNDAVNRANAGTLTHNAGNDQVAATGLPTTTCNVGTTSNPYKGRNNGNEYFAWMFTQQIFVHDNTPPLVNDPGEQKFYLNKNTCTAAVSITFTASDVCSKNTEVQQTPTQEGNLAIERVRIRPFNGAAVEIGTLGGTVTPAHALNGDNKGGNSWTFAAAALPEGNHTLVVVVRDDCGNLSTVREIPFSIADTNGIAPICYHGLSTDLMFNPATGTGEMAIWASDFKASEVDDCNGQGPATGPTGKPVITKYYVVKDQPGAGNGTWGPEDGLNDKGIPTAPATSVVFNCADLQGDTIASVMVRLYTVDERGNWAWCETYAVITDARKVCGSGSAASAAVAGAITTESRINVEGVEVNLSGNATMVHTTNASGQFSFGNLSHGYDYTVTPHLDRNYLNGVSTLDLVQITRHILGVQPLDSPYKLIAADVNNSKSVTTLDLVQLRKLILGLDSKFSNNTSWRFVDAAYRFPNPSNPWAAQFPEVANINDLSADARANFIAVKIGDVNGNALANSQIRTAGTFVLNVDDQPVKAGNEYRIPFTGDLSSIEGYQFTLGFDRNLVELVDIEYGVARAENFGVFEREGLITASWNEAQGAGRKAQGETLFTLVLRAKADAVSLREALNVNSRITHAEAYRTGGEFLSVEIALTPERLNAPTRFALDQNTPNPFAGETLIGFTLPEAGEATLTIQDVTGRTLRVIRGQYAEGYNQVIVKAADLNASGVLTYTLTAGVFAATKKMIVLE